MVTREQESKLRMFIPRLEGAIAWLAGQYVDSDEVWSEFYLFLLSVVGRPDTPPGTETNYEAGKKAGEKLRFWTPVFRRERLERISQLRAQAEFLEGSFRQNLIDWCRGYAEGAGSPETCHS